MGLIIFFEQVAISTQPTTGYERRMIALVDPLHFCITFLGVWYLTWKMETTFR